MKNENEKLDLLVNKLNNSKSEYTIKTTYKDLKPGISIDAASNSFVKRNRFGFLKYVAIGVTSFVFTLALFVFLGGGLLKKTGMVAEDAHPYTDTDYSDNENKQGERKPDGEISSVVDLFNCFSLDDYSYSLNADGINSMLSSLTEDTSKGGITSKDSNEKYIAIVSQSSETNVLNVKVIDTSVTSESKNVVKEFKFQDANYYNLLNDHLDETLYLCYYNDAYCICKTNNNGSYTIYQTKEK